MEEKVKNFSRRVRENWTLGVRSFNIFGPTGLPVLPSMNPWLIQTNAWKIEVQGKINRFEVFDGDGDSKVVSSMFS